MALTDEQQRTSSKRVRSWSVRRIAALSSFHVPRLGLAALEGRRVPERRECARDPMLIAAVARRSRPRCARARAVAKSPMCVAICAASQLAFTQSVTSATGASIASFSQRRPSARRPRTYQEQRGRDAHPQGGVVLPEFEEQRAAPR